MSSSCEDSSSSRKSGECHRFFGFGKRIPRDVKRHCGMCRQHGLVFETRGHICQFKNCECDKCKLVRKRRSIMSTQIRLRREQDKRFQRTTIASEADVVPLNSVVFEADKRDDMSLCYFCQKCKNHGVLMWKKDHKRNCEFANCRCEQCNLIDTRRALDRHIKKTKEMKSVNSSDYSSSSSSTEEYSSGCDSSTAQLPLHLPISVPCSTQMAPMLPLRGMSYLEPTIDNASSLLLPNCFNPTFLPPTTSLNSSFLPISPLLYGGLLPPTSNEFVLSNILSALSPFEIQLMLISLRSTSTNCLNY